MGGRIILNISGGAIKFVAMASCFTRLVSKGFKPDVISGVSSGAILAFFYVCGRLDEAYELSKKSYDKRVIFSRKNDPTRLFVQIRNIIKGRNYFGVMDNLETNIKKIVSQTDFYYYRDHGIDCYIMSVDEFNGEQVLVNIKDLSYQDAIDHVIASSSIAPTVKSKRVNHDGVTRLLNDGGHRDHSAGAYILTNKIVNNIKECVTIFSRPSPFRYKESMVGDTSTFFKRLVNFTINTFIRETSLNDEYQEKEECENIGAKYSPIYLDSFTQSTYGISKQEIKKGIKIGEKAADKYLKK